MNKFTILLSILFFPIATFAAPINDDLANTTPIISTPFSDIVSFADATTATREPNELHIEYNPNDPDEVSWWYSFTPTADGSILIETGDDTSNNLECDTRLGVYTGVSHPLTTVALIDDDLGFPIDGEVLSVPVTMGITYHIQTQVDKSQIDPDAICRTDVAFTPITAVPVPTMTHTGIFLTSILLLWIGFRRRTFS